MKVRGKAFQPNELILTCKGCSCVNWDCVDTDFEFVGGHEKVCRVHPVLAEFLSPKVARLRRSDISFNCYTFENCALFNVFETFVRSLHFGRALHVNQSNFTELLELSEELENAELLSSLVQMINPKHVALEKAIRLLRVGIDLGTTFQSLRDFVASRFYNIKRKVLENLDLEITQLLLSSPSLKIEDEDSLYHFIRSRSEKDLRFASLFEFVCFEFLTIGSSRDFMSFLNENLLVDVNSNIWRGICRRFILETQPKTNPRCPSDKFEFVYDDSNPLEGIIAYLTRECGGNVHEKGIVNVTASSVFGPYDQKNAVDLDTDVFYESKNEKDTWICYDFKEQRVIPTSYTVRTNGVAFGGSHLKSWVIEVSNDKHSWTEIDRRDNNNDLNGSHATRNFKISHVRRKRFRFFRLRQTGENHYHPGPNYYVTITALEIFGTLLGK